MLQLKNPNEELEQVAGSERQHKAAILSLYDILNHPVCKLKDALDREWKVLEVVAGIGRNVEVLKKFFKKKHIVLQDGCNELLQKAKEYGVTDLRHEYLDKF